MASNTDRCGKQPFRGPRNFKKAKRLRIAEINEKNQIKYEEIRRKKHPERYMEEDSRYSDWENQ